MKKFTKILICLMICLFTVCLGACDGRTPEEKAFTYPTSSDIVSGNGGLAVAKGDYIYFVNGYMSAGDENFKQKSNYTLGALMLMKLDNGNIVTDEDGLLKDEYYITMSGRLSGFEATDLHIFGDYLYFVTPSLDNEGGQSASNNKTEWAKERVEFYRIKLDKSSKLERLYQSSVSYSNIEYKYYEDNGNIYILVYEKGASKDSSKSDRLIRVKNGSSSEITDDIDSIVISDNGEDIFYIVTDEDDNKLMKRYNIFTDSILDFDSIDASVKLVSEEYVYVVNSRGFLLRRAFDVASGSWEEMKYASDYAKLYLAPYGDVVFGVDGNYIDYLTSNRASIQDTDTESITIIGFKNGMIYYYDDNSTIKSVDIDDNNPVINIVYESEDISTDYFDISEDKFLYFYQSVESGNEYLYRINLNTNSEAEMVGVYLKADIPETDDEE